jgi:hypothetical protein
MRIEALEDIKSHGLRLTAGDVVTVPDDAGAAFCAAGWAKDTAGVVATGERHVLNARILVGTAAHGQAAQTVGVK